ncbi:MAG: hypothetical protein ACKVP4_00985 [Hyphomicrobium sp.]
MSKDKSMSENSGHSVSFGTSEGVATNDPDLRDEVSVAQYLDLIAPDLEVAARDADEPLCRYAERLLSAVQDIRFYLSDELDELEHDLENIIDHLNGGHAS